MFTVKKLSAAIWLTVQICDILQKGNFNVNSILYILKKL